MFIAQILVDRRGSIGSQYMLPALNWSQALPLSSTSLQAKDLLNGILRVDWHLWLLDTLSGTVCQLSCILRWGETLLGLDVDYWLVIWVFIDLGDIVVEVWMHS
jgi:hypothetical protein